MECRRCLVIRILSVCLSVKRIDCDKGEKSVQFFSERELTHGMRSPSTAAMPSVKQGAVGIVVLAFMAVGGLVMTLLPPRDRRGCYLVAVE